MKLLSPGILLATALVATVSAQDNALGRRQGVNSIQSNNAVQDFLGLAGSDDLSADDAGPTASAQNDDNNSAGDNHDGDKLSSVTLPGTTPASSSPASSSERPSSSKSQSASETSESGSKSESESASKSKSESSSSAEPSATGTPCSKSGDKQCSPNNPSGFQVCEDGFWSDQKCSGSNVCGKDSKGEIACVSKDQATVSYESCSKKNEKRCAASDPTKYQVCDGDNWQTYSCDKSSTCAMDGDNVVCGSLETGEDGAVSYTMHEPTAFVPLSTAPQVRAALGTVVAAFGIAAFMSFAGF